VVNALVISLVRQARFPKKRYDSQCLREDYFILKHLYQVISGRVLYGQFIDQLNATLASVVPHRYKSMEDLEKDPDYFHTLISAIPLEDGTFRSFFFKGEITVTDSLFDEETYFGSATTDGYTIHTDLEPVEVKTHTVPAYFCSWAFAKPILAKPILGKSVSGLKMKAPWLHERELEFVIAPIRRHTFRGSRGMHPVPLNKFVRCKFGLLCMFLILIWVQC